MAPTGTLAAIALGLVLGALSTSFRAAEPPRDPATPRREDDVEWHTRGEPGMTDARPGDLDRRAEALSDARDDARRLAAEVRGLGWIVYAARSERGDWDLFASRPDGASKRQITDTPEWSEAGARLSPDGTRLLYYRQAKDVPLDQNTYGSQDLVVAEPDGSRPVVLGGGLAWASWHLGSERIACLAKEGVRIVDISTRTALRSIPRRGMVQQIIASPDGAAFVGTANGLGPYWTIGCMDGEGRSIRAVSEVDRYNCTPDWFPDSRRIVYSRGIVPEKGGWAELWVAGVEGSAAKPAPLYAEEGRHVYGGCVSPDGSYVLFTRSVTDLGKVDSSQTTMAIVRVADCPIALRSPVAGRGKRGEASGKLRSVPRLDLEEGWEPHWTSVEILRTGGADAR